MKKTYFDHQLSIFYQLSSRDLDAPVYKGARISVCTAVASRFSRAMLVLPIAVACQRC